MIIYLDDSACRDSLYPFTANKHVADIRIGILTILEKWALLKARGWLQQEASTITIAANLLPTMANAQDICTTVLNGGVINENTAYRFFHHPYHIFQLNDWAIRQDVALITHARVGQKISATNHTINEQDIFIEEGAVVEHCILNASEGPIYIGKNALMMEGCLIRGPFALCDHAVLKMGTKVYGATTIGPHCVAGGEIKNSMLQAYSNKAHDGYLGDSVIGEWCNLGAGSSTSNIKNTASLVKVWNNTNKNFEPIGLKCGLIMGDYSRTAINTSFNTGTVVGVCCNIFESGFPPKMIPHFSWGKECYDYDKAMQDISNWKQLKAQQLTETEKDILKEIYINK